MQNPRNHASTCDGVGVASCFRASHFEAKTAIEWSATTKKRRCETFSDKTLGDETLSEHPEGYDYPQSDDSEASCSTSTDSGSHDSDSPSWMQDADFEHECDVDYQWDHHTHQCDHTEVESNEESYIEFDHDHNEAFAEVVEALSDDL